MSTVFTPRVEDPYQIELKYKGKFYSVEVALYDHGSGTNYPQAWDDPGGFEIEKEPSFFMEVWVLDEDWELEGSPDESLVKKAEEVFQEIYWDRYIYC